MSVLIGDMEMPTAGLYIVSIDNTNGRDKTVATVERMLCIRNIRQIVGAFELSPVPPHGRLIDADALAAKCDDPHWCVWLSDIEDAPTVIPADPAEEEDE